MNQSTKQQLQYYIAKAISETEYNEDYALLPADHDFLVESLVNFVEQSAHKFILGAKEHNGEEHPTPFLTSCPHLVELPKEIYDAYFYSYAAIKSIRSNRS